eukprot:10587894-Ditylum_brightwellii.AAC.1
MDIPTTCQHDCCIIDRVTQLLLSSLIIQKINYCHLYLQVAHLSDITTSNGTCLVETALKNLSELNNQQLDLNWPIQDPPDSST